MSRIPKSAMKHASSNNDQQMQQGQNESEGGRWSQMSQQMADGATRIADRARSNPGKALAIGAGVLAAAAVPLFRWGQNDETARKASDSRKSSGAKASTSAKRSAAARSSAGRTGARGKKKTS